jgi:hypothetical protein
MQQQVCQLWLFARRLKRGPGPAAAAFLCATLRRFCSSGVRRARGARRGGRLDGGGPGRRARTGRSGTRLPARARGSRRLRCPRTGRRRRRRAVRRGHPTADPRARGRHARRHCGARVAGAVNRRAVRSRTRVAGADEGRVGADRPHPRCCLSVPRVDGQHACRFRPSGALPPSGGAS